MLCPVALDSSWEGKDDPFWQYLRDTYFVLNFSKWQDDDAFDTQFAKLLKGMKIYYPPKGGA